MKIDDNVKHQYFLTINKILAEQLSDATKEIDKCNEIIKLCKLALRNHPTKSLENLLSEIKKIEERQDDKDPSEKNP